MQKLSILFLSILLPACLSAQESYKELMDDMSVNFYDVVKAAEAHFAMHGTGEGSGYKGFQRWKNENESKYYPSGDRSQTDLHFAEKAYQAFLINNPQPANERRTFDEWEDLGPYDANHVTGHYSPGIGRVEAFYVDPRDPRRIYLGSRSGGFWRTTNEGQSWECTTDEMIATGVNAIAVSPTNPDSVLINVQNPSNESTHGIYRSVNGGFTWSPTRFIPMNLGWGGLGRRDIIHFIMYHPLIPGLVFIGTPRGLFRSTDNLQTWTQLLSGGNFTDIEFHPSNPNIVYLIDANPINHGKILISYDEGLTFGPTSTAPNKSFGSGFLAVSEDCHSCVYLAAGDGVWLYDLISGTWDFLSNPIGGTGGFAVSDVDTANMIYGFVNLLASTNGGKNFTEVCNWLLDQNPPDAYVHADLRTAGCVNGVFYVGTDGYLAKSTNNGTNWVLLNDGTGIRENYGVALSQSNWRFNMCGSQDNGTSILTDKGWIEFNGGDGMHAVIHPLNPAWMIGSYQFGERHGTYDGGLTRRTASVPGGISYSINQPQGAGGDWEAPILLDPNNQMRVFDFHEDIFVTEDFGENWQLHAGPGIGLINEAAIAYNLSRIMVISSHNTLMLSTDQGKNFSLISQLLPFRSIKAITFAPNDDRTIVVVYNNYQNDGEKVFITRDLGQSWTNITYNLGDMPLRAVAIDHTSENNIYVGGEIGIYYKAIQDTSWQLYNTGLPNTAVHDLEIQMGSNVLRAASWGRGLWEYTLAGRNDYPRILTTEITHTPTASYPRATVCQHVTSTISYGRGLSEVFVKYSAGNPVFTETLKMINISDSTWKTETPIPGFEEGKKVYFKVYAIGNQQDTTVTYKFMYEEQRFFYCTAAGTNSTGPNFIDYVGLKGISHASAQDYYGDFLDKYATIYTDSTYTLHINLNFHYDQDTTGAWIDFNGDGEFLANEFIAMSSLNNNHESFGSFKVPTDVKLDTVRMRVRSQFYNETPTPCGARIGEVEDYSIIIKKGPNVSIEGDLIAQQIKVYPNPNQGIFQLELPGAKAATYELVDAQGKVITSGVTKQPKTQLEVTEVSTGIYFLHIVIDGEDYVKKIIKE